MLFVVVNSLDEVWFFNYLAAIACFKNCWCHLWDTWDSANLYIVSGSTNSKLKKLSSLLCFTHENKTQLLAE